jgi:hypothetical protein
MKKPIVLSVIMALMLLVGSSFAPSHAQDSAKEEKPTFHRLTPGVYVNGWPRFTIHYPKDWVERRPETVQTFRVSPPGPVGYPALLVSFGAIPLPFETLAESWFIKVLSLFNTEVALVSDKPSRLRDGTPAREFEIRMVRNGAPLNTLNLVTKKDDLVRIIAVESAVEPVTGRIGEDLKAILYSIEFEPDKDKPVKVPPDVQEFLDKHNNDVLGHDIAKVMANYSDRYINSGNRKGEVERGWRQIIGYITSSEGVITDFVAEGDRAYVAGYVILKTTGLWPSQIWPISETSIIKESGEWKWYGNQRDPAP